MIDPITCLLIDDDSEELGTIKFALSKVDPTIKCFQSLDGEQAIELLKRSTHTPSFILLDLNMPRIPGNKILMHLKNDEVLKKIPVVIYSNSIDDITQHKLKSLGAYDHITKPYTINDLVSKLKTVIKRILFEFY